MIRRALVLGILLSLLVGRAALAEPDGERRGEGGQKVLKEEEAKKILHGLEMGMAALKALGKHEEAKRLDRIANEVREKLKAQHAGDGERAAVKRWIEGMRVAMHGLLEAEKKDLAERLEHAIHAYELMLEGRRDEEAMRIRRSAPDREAQVEILIHAAKIWDELGHERKAEQVEQVARELMGRGQGRRKTPPGKSDREQLAHRIEVMMVALPALMEAEKRDAADLLERAIHAYRMRYEGRKDDEAHQIMERAPSAGQQAEILSMAARLWKQFEDPKKAELCHRLAGELAAEDRARKHPEGKQAGRDRPREGGDRIADLERRLGEMQRMLEEMRRELQRLRGGR